MKHLVDGIYELRWRQANNHFRVVFFRWGPHPVALTAFYKNQQQTPQQDIDRARDRRKTWRQVFGERPPDAQVFFTKTLHRFAIFVV